MCIEKYIAFYLNGKTSSVRNSVSQTCVRGNIHVTLQRTLYSACIPIIYYQLFRIYHYLMDMCPKDEKNIPG